ncbi:hypothetical protein LTS18_003277 [Coniosporium uncinatum]|uniref:Uncharacterized protein n=1 Tax=Coniosporium uncinatum TaxID=93489 RepID=A0ACC3D7B3_9PEZI|nr:hypothetical protein LTS18_003277 [Coniosporium uncinatum]
MHTRVKHVTRNGDEATGVLATVNGTERIIPLSDGGRVILSGGALQSPQILMYSSFGEPAILQNLSSTGILDLPRSQWINNSAVGDELFDNPNIFIELSRPDLHSYVYSYASPPSSDESAFLNSRSGPYSFASETSAFWDNKAYNSSDVVGFQGTIDSSGFSDYTNNSTITLNVYEISGLKSKGRVVLDSEKHLPGPSSDVYYSNERDAQDIVAFIRGIFDALPSDLTPLAIPRNATIEEIETYITTPSAYAVGMVNHWSGSCRFGSCVDVNTTVIGMKNLNVIDGSIVAPLTVNPQMGIMIAAERACELLLGME